MSSKQDESVVGSAPMTSTNPGVTDTSLPPAASGDVEATKEAGAEPNVDDGKPHYPIWQWVLTLVALYFNAFLYGKRVPC